LEPVLSRRVYEFINEAGEDRLQINAKNCVHCKTYDINDPVRMAQHDKVLRSRGPRRDL